MDDVLVCILGHINNELKKQNDLQLLLGLKKENLKTCYITHSPQSLNEISEVSDFVFYDKNNLFIKSTDYINNSDLFDETSFDYGYSNYYNFFSYGCMNLNRVAAHNPAVLISFKNAINISFFNSFKWVVIIHYDLEYPTLGFYNLIKEKLEVLKNNNKSCFIYKRNDHSYFWPDFVLLSTDKIINNELLMKTDWYTSARNWVKYFKLGVTETILEKIFDTSFNNEIIKELIENDCKKYWNVQDYKCLDKFSVGNYDFTYIIKILPFKTDHYSFYIYIGNLTNETLTVKSLKIKTNDKIIYYITNSEHGGCTWNINELDKNQFDLNETLCLEYEIMQGGRTENIIEQYDLKNTDKIYNYIVRFYR